MPDADSRRAFALRLLAEFGVIVVGVLVALGVDSWAAARQDRALEAEYLGRLLDDVRYDIDELEMVEVVSRVGSETSGALRTPEVLDTITAGRLVSSVIAVGNVRIADPSRSTFQELINSGQIVLIRSPTIRRALASYERTITELDGAWNMFAPSLRPWYAARIPQDVYARFRATESCTSGSAADDVDVYEIVCDFDLDEWSPDALRSDVRAESGQQLFRQAEYNHGAHAFFASLLLAEARALEALLQDEVAATTRRR